MKRWTKSEETLKPDPRYQNRLVSKFINCIMRRGKKTSAQRVFYGSMDVIEQKVPGTPPLTVFENAVQNVKPVLEVRSRRVGGATYQVPVEVKKKRQTALAIRWILESVHSKKGRSTHLKLADEIVAAFKKEGEAIKKRENVHKMAEANRAFAHYAW